MLEGAHPCRTICARQGWDFDSLRVTSCPLWLDSTAHTLAPSRPPPLPHTSPNPNLETAPRDALREPASPTHSAFPDSARLPDIPRRPCQTAPFAISWIPSASPA